MSTPKQTDPQFKLRMTPAIKEAIEAAASANKRSMNAEILARLEASLEPSEAPQVMTAELFRELFGNIREIRESVADMKKKNISPTNTDE